MTSYRSGQVGTSAQHINTLKSGVEPNEPVRYLNKAEGVSQSQYRNSAVTGTSDVKGTYKFY